MSLITLINSPHGIVVTSDRRITEFNYDSGSNITSWYVGTDHERKTFLTEQHHSISYYNDSFLDGTVMSLVISEFVKFHTKPCTVEETAISFTKFILNKSNKIPNTWFLFSGYDGTTINIFQSHPQTNKISQLKGTFIAAGQSDIAMSLWEHKIGDETTKISNIALTIPGMVELSKFFLEATNIMQRFQCRYCGVSKECDILIITPNSAYWAVPPETPIQFHC